MTADRFALGVLFVGAGAMHFGATPVYMKIMPPLLPEPRLLVQVSGVAEMLGGVWVLLPQTRRAAAWVWLRCWWLCCRRMFIWPWTMLGGPGIPEWLLWARLPLQLPLMVWAWMYTRGGKQV